MSLEEQALVGGINPKRTVRVGNTIRRPTHRGTATIHALLDYIRARGFPAPQPLGIDDKGREILSFIDGEASLWPWPEFLRRPGGAQAIGRMLRRYHDLVADFPLRDTWMTETRTPASGEIICHGDFGPHNLIWRGEDIVGVIDWEWAYSGPAIEDVAFAAWQAVPLRNDADVLQVGFTVVPDRRERLRMLLTAYGRFTAAEIVTNVLAVQDKTFEDMERLGRQGIEPWKTYCEMGLRERNRRDHAWLLDNMKTLSD
jgi:Ser/Thr protein kinase RdoA (MazF antagonist)